MSIEANIILPSQIFAELINDEPISEAALTIFHKSINIKLTLDKLKFRCQNNTKLPNMYNTTKKTVFYLVNLSIMQEKFTN